MSEKVLGVPIKWSKCFGTNNGIRYEIAVYESELVSVRLASESVDLKKLKKFMSRRSLEIMEKTDKSEYAQGFEYGFCKAFTEVENWAEKEAKK